MTISSPFPLLNVSRGKSSIDDAGDDGSDAASTSTVTDGADTMASMVLQLQQRRLLVVVVRLGVSACVWRLVVLTEKLLVGC